jgi:hypothetical protein
MYLHLAQLSHVLGAFAHKICLQHLDWCQQAQHVMLLQAGIGSLI